MKKIAVIGAGVIGITSILQLIEQRTNLNAENDCKIVWLYDTSIDIFGIGESTTPSITKDDLFVVISGSGSTEHLRILTEKAKSVGAEVVLLTTSPNSAIGKLANAVIELPAGTKYDAEGSTQPLGSLFEQASQILLDSIVLDLMSELNVDEETMQQNHANLE